MKPLLFVAAVALGGVALAEGLPIQAGMWETAVTTTAIDMPNAPPQVAAMMKGRTTTVRHCVTAEEAANGPQAMLKSGKSCSFGRYTVAGGRFDAEMTCSEHGSTMTATSSGSYTPTSYSGTSHIVMSGGTGMSITSTSSAHRIGAC